MEKQLSLMPLPRRTLLVGSGLALLTPLVAAKAKAAPTRHLGATKVTISGTGHGFRRVTAHFALPDGSSVPFYAWNSKGSTASFTMPLTTKGLRLSVEGAKPQELTLEAGKATGTHVLKHDGSELRITVAAA